MQIENDGGDPSRPAPAVAGDAPGLWTLLKGPSEACGSDWVIVSGSASGTDTASGAEPQQDRCVVTLVAPHVGIAVICDGAGSYRRAAEGAEYVATGVSRELTEYVRSHVDVAPAHDSWRAAAAAAVRKLASDLRVIAATEGCEATDYSCTLVVLAFAPTWYCCAHVGDGRAAVRSHRGVWGSVLTPTKGDQAGETVFLTSVLWSDADLTAYLGTSVGWGAFDRFVLASDGAERVAFLCTQQVIIGGEPHYYDANTPFPGFLDPVADTVLARVADPAGVDPALNEDWHRFLERGTDALPALRDEPDDKTLVLGVLRCHSE